MLYTGLSTTGSPYIGNAVYPQGSNPFDVVDTPTLTIWEWCLIGLGGLLVILLAAFLIYKFCCNKETSRRESVANDHDIVYGTIGSETLN